MSVESQAMRGLIDAIEHQEKVESWLSLLGIKGATLDLDATTSTGRACEGWHEAMREIEAVINQPEFTELIVQMVRGKLEERVQQARLKLQIAQQAAKS